VKTRSPSIDIDPTLKARFAEDGYCIVRGLYTPEELEPVRNRLEELWEGRHDYPWPNEKLSTNDPNDRNTPGGNYRSGSLQLPASLESVFSTFARNARLVSVMETLLGGPVKPFTDQTIFKPGIQKANRSFYHQDTFYWRLRPGVCINAWIALDEVDRDSCALAFLPGSHRNWRIAFHEEYWDEVRFSRGKDGKAVTRRRIPQSAIDDSTEILTPGKPGDAFFFNNYTWHRAEPNLSGLNKAAYAIACQLDRTDNPLSEKELEALTDKAPAKP